MKIVALAVLVAALAAPAALAGRSEDTFKGVVGPGFTITLSHDGKKVTKLKAGTYKFVISDKASIHNFHLFGPGVNKTTSVGGMGTSKWTLKLKKGKYTYQCDPHAAAGMKASFTVS